MDKETLSNYGWIVICVLVLAVMIALATPFGSYVKTGVENTATGLVETSNKGMDVALLSTGTPNNNGGNESPAPIVRNNIIPENGVYYRGGELCMDCRLVYGIQGINHGPMTDGSYEFTQSPTATYTSGQEFPQTVEVGDIYIEDDFRYCYFSDGWRVSVLENKAQYNGTILSEINGKKVTSMHYTFWNCTSLTTTPTIPSSVTNMQDTFYGCTSLTTAPVIPNSVTNMHSTFFGCTKLTTAPAIPSSVTDMTNAFTGCTSLTTAPTIPNSVTSLYYTFSGCTSLAVAPTISNSVTNMTNTFSGCTSLTTALIPSSVTDMTYTFRGCTSLTTAPIIPSSVTDMTYTFYNCTSLTTAPVIPNSVTNMWSTFMGCNSLTTAPIIPSSVTNMDNTFNGCTSLTGTIEVNANPTYYSKCLKSTQITSITGSCLQATKNALMSTK